MKSIEERAKEYVSKKHIDCGNCDTCVKCPDYWSYISIAKEQKAIDDAECVNQVIMGKGSAISHYKQGYHDAVNKACELLKAVGVLTDDDSIMGFIKAMEE